VVVELDGLVETDERSEFGFVVYQEELPIFVFDFRVRSGN
jgi:hypothetical protein